MWTDQRRARNEAAHRDLNEAIRAGRTNGDSLIGFVCECGRSDCDQIVELSGAEYEQLRASARTFAVRPTHVDGREDVVRETDRYTVVRKNGPAADVVERDPRSST